MLVFLKYAKNHQKLVYEMRPKDQFMSCCDKQKTLVEKI